MSARKDTAPVDAATLRAAVLADVHIEEARLKVGEDIARAALAELAVQAAEIQAAHDQAAAAARASFTAAPPAPQLPDGQPHRDALHHLLRARAELAARQVEVLAAALPTVVQGWDVARPQLDEQARQLASQANELAESYASWWRLVREARRASETADPNARIRNGPSERMRPRPTAADVLAAATGADLCGAGPSDADIQAMLVSGRLSDGSNRVMVDRS